MRIEAGFFLSSITLSVSLSFFLSLTFNESVFFFKVDGPLPRRPGVKDHRRICMYIYRRMSGGCVYLGRSLVLFRLPHKAATRQDDVSLPLADHIDAFHFKTCLRIEDIFHAWHVI